MSTNTKRWTLKEPYRNLLDAKLSAATEAEAIDRLQATFSWRDADMAYIDRPSIFDEETDPSTYRWLLSLYQNAYTRSGSTVRLMPKEELRTLLQEVINQA